MVDEGTAADSDDIDEVKEPSASPIGYQPPATTSFSARDRLASRLRMTWSATPSGTAKTM